MAKPRTKAQRRADREAVGAYHEAELARLLEHVRMGFARYDAGEIDAFELDELIHHYKRATQKLWSACVGGGAHSRAWPSGSSGKRSRASRPTGGRSRDRAAIAEARRRPERSQGPHVGDRHPRPRSPPTPRHPLSRSGTAPASRAPLPHASESPHRRPYHEHNGRPGTQVHRSAVPTHDRLGASRRLGDTSRSREVRDVDGSGGRDAPALATRERGNRPLVRHSSTAVFSLAAETR
jgi:hypothetical protein